MASGRIHRGDVFCEGRWTARLNSHKKLSATAPSASVAADQKLPGMGAAGMAVEPTEARK